MYTPDGIETTISRVNHAHLSRERLPGDQLQNFVARALVGFKEAIGRAWLRHLICRSCESTECFLKALDDQTLDRIGLERADIRAAVRDLEVELLRQLDPSSDILDLQAERS
jgi:uncharacterized protein YjiS (DUF1127 family)